MVVNLQGLDKYVSKHTVSRKTVQEILEKHTSKQELMGNI